MAINCILSQATRLINCVPIQQTTHIVVGGLKTKLSKKFFRKLNEHSNELQAKQEEIAKKHNSLSAQYEELEHLKNNMNEYLGRDKVEKKESVIETLNIEKARDKVTTKETARNNRKHPKEIDL